MLRYYLDIQEAIEAKLPIYQYCIYIGKDKNYLKDKIVNETLNYHYNLIDTREIDCEHLLNEPTPEAKVLAILCDFKQKEPRDVVRYILKELHRLVKDEKRLRDFMMVLEILSTNRDLKETVKEEKEMLRTMTYRDLPSYEVGYEERAIEDAVIMVKDFNIEPKIVAEKLNISLELLLNKLTSKNSKKQ